MKRGEIWWAALKPPAGRRPVLLLSRDEAYAIRAHVTVAPVSTQIRNIPTEVALGIDDGLPRPSAVNLDSIQTIPKSALTRRVTALAPSRMEAVEDAVRFALAMK